jgi:hypothetical protein
MRVEASLEHMSMPQNARMVFLLKWSGKSSKTIPIHCLVNESNVRGTGNRGSDVPLAAASKSIRKAIRKPKACSALAQMARRDHSGPHGLGHR